MGSVCVCALEEVWTTGPLGCCGRSGVALVRGVAVHQGRMLALEFSGFLLDRAGLSAGQLRRHKRNPILATLLSFRSCQNRPEVGFGHVLGNAAPHPEIGAQSILRADMALFGRP